MEKEIEKEIELLKSWQQQINQHIETVSDCLNKFKPISREHIESKEELQKDVFNIFNIISDLYYRENFHSDIIRFFLDPNEKHNGGCVFLNAFIQMLNKQMREKGKSIDTNDYKDAVVAREKGRIDVWIKSETTKKCIIVENKINNAGDMQRQIPRYYDYVKRKGYDVDTIVYLPLDITKVPNKSDWTIDDKKNVEPLLVIIPAYDRSKKINLVDDWLRPSILLSDNIDVVSTLRQYSLLITKLNYNIMDNIVLEKFYEELKKENNFATAKSIRNMLNELPQYLAQRIQNKFGGNCQPFEKVWIYSTRDAVFEKAVINGIYTKMDIWCYDERYDVVFWCPEEQDSENFANLIGQIQSLQDFEPMKNGNQIVKHFDFTEEDKLYAFINNLLKELRNLPQ